MQINVTNNHFFLLSTYKNNQKYYKEHKFNLFVSTWLLLVNVVNVYICETYECIKFIYNNNNHFEQQQYKYTSQQHNNRKLRKIKKKVKQINNNCVWGLSFLFVFVYECVVFPLF